MADKSIEIIAKPNSKQSSGELILPDQALPDKLFILPQKLAQALLHKETVEAVDCQR